MSWANLKKLFDGFVTQNTGKSGNFIQKIFDFFEEILIQYWMPFKFFCTVEKIAIGGKNPAFFRANMF